MIDSEQAGHRARGRVTLACLLAILAWSTIPLGSNRPWSLALLCALAASLLAFWLIGIALRPRRIAPALRESTLPLALLALWVALSIAQLLPLPIDLVGAIGGTAHRSYLVLSRLVPMDTAHLSVDRGATLDGLFLQCSVLSVFVLVLVLGTSAGRVRLLMRALFVIGFAEALYGLTVFLAGDANATAGAAALDAKVTGTYVNQNHFAGLMELTIPAGLAMFLMRTPAAAFPATARQLTRSVISFVLDGRGIIAFCLLIMSGALILTASRGAFLSLCAGIGLASLCALLTRGFRARELGAGLLLAATLVGAALWFGTGELGRKLEVVGLESNREHLREVSHAALAQHPFTGTGTGTFRWVFPSYKDERFGTGFYEHAHNDFLEIALEQGVAGLIIVGGALTGILVHLIAGLRRADDPAARAAIFAALAGSSSLLIHGLVDFNLHIPANAVLFFALIGTGCCAVGLRTGAQAHAPRGQAMPVVHPVSRTFGY